MTIHENDLLLVEVDSTCANLAVGRHLIGYGKNRLEILGKELALFQSLLETEVDEWKRANSKFSLALHKIQGEDKDDVDFRKMVLVKKNGPAKRFREDNLRDPLPLLAVDIVENKGRQFTKEEILERQNQENSSERREFLEFLKRGTPSAESNEVAQLKAQVEELTRTLKAITEASFNKK